MATYKALQYNVTVVHGDDWQQPLRLAQDIGGVRTPIDLTSATISAQVQKSEFNDTPIVAMTVSPVDLANGQFIISLTDAQTQPLRGNLFYKVKVTFGTFTETYMMGNFILQ